MIAKGASLPELRCFVPGSTVTNLGDVAPGEYLVVCTVICSQDHEGMIMRFVVLP